MSDEAARGAPARDPGPDKGIPEEGVQPRGKWANSTEFILCMVGGLISPGTIFRFPYLCYKNGGAAFFIPYFLILFFCGFPVFFLEMALGQYTSEGGVTAWRKICPMFEGLGIASQVIVSYLNIYSIVPLSYSVLYLYYSFKDPLPWSTCDNQWNTDSCHRPISYFANPDLFQPDSDWSFLNNITSHDEFYSFSEIWDRQCLEIKLAFAKEEFHFRQYTGRGVLDLLQQRLKLSKINWRVLRFSGNMLQINWDLALCLLIVWILVYLCICMGIKSMGKVMYFTATFPFLLLFIFFIRGVTLPGAADGLKVYLYPRFYMITSINVWCDAATQVLYSFTTCLGVLTALGSYNKYNYNCYRDSLVLCGLSSVTCIFAGFVTFSFHGFMAHDQGVALEEVAHSGVTLAYLGFANAVSRLPVPSLWAVLFFLMMLFLGLNSQFVCVESLATALRDVFPRYLRSLGNRELLPQVIAVVCFVLGLPFITQGGTLLFYLFDIFGACEVTFFFIAFTESIVIGWVYGADRFYNNIEDMIGYRPFPVLKYCWLFIMPLVYGIMLLLSLTRQRSFMVFDYVAGAWAQVVAFLLLVIPLLCVPVFVLVSLYRNGQNMTTPSKDLRQAQPHKPILTLCKCVIFKAPAQPSRSVEEGNGKMMMEER